MKSRKAGIKPGKAFEEKVLGMGTKLFKQSVSEPISYKPYREAMNEVKDVVKASDCWDCGDPDGCINDLHFYVAQVLELENWSDLKLYPAIGSALDRFHGVDCFFQYKGNICTIDITLRNKGGYKATIEIGPDDFKNPGPVVQDIAVRLREY